MVKENLSDFEVLCESACVKGKVKRRASVFQKRKTKARIAIELEITQNFILFARVGRFPGKRKALNHTQKKSNKILSSYIYIYLKRTVCGTVTAQPAMEELRALNETLFIGVAVVVKKEDERQDILFVRKMFCFFFL